MTAEKSLFSPKKKKFITNQASVTWLPGYFSTTDQIRRALSFYEVNGGLILHSAFYLILFFGF